MSHGYDHQDFGASEQTQRVRPPVRSPEFEMEEMRSLTQNHNPRSPYMAPQPAVFSRPESVYSYYGSAVDEDDRDAYSRSPTPKPQEFGRRYDSNAYNAKSYDSSSYNSKSYDSSSYNSKYDSRSSTPVPGGYPKYNNNHRVPYETSSPYSGYSGLSGNNSRFASTTALATSYKKLYRQPIVSIADADHVM